MAQTGIHSVVKMCRLPSALTTSSHTRKKRCKLYITVLQFLHISTTLHTSPNKQYILNNVAILCNSLKKTDSRTCENHHPLQKGCHTQEADCILPCRWSTEDGDASSISSLAAEPCRLNSVCTTRLLFKQK